VLADAMYDRLDTEPIYSCRVTSVQMAKPEDKSTSNMKLTVQAPSKKLVEKVAKMEFSHVISTIPFSVLRSIDLSSCALSYAQKIALRSLHYGPSIKVGIKFKTPWWRTEPFGSQKGGQSSTDRPSRVVVYPSYGLEDDLDKPAVLIAPYNWFVCPIFATPRQGADISD
jgi:monoamine oxidase